MVVNHVLAERVFASGEQVRNILFRRQLQQKRFMQFWAMSFFSTYPLCLALEARIAKQYN